MAGDLPRNNFLMFASRTVSDGSFAAKNLPCLASVGHEDAADGGEGGGEPAFHAEFGHDVADVRARRKAALAEDGSNLRVAFAFAQPDKHLGFAGSQGGKRRPDVADGQRLAFQPALTAFLEQQAVSAVLSGRDGRDARAPWSGATMFTKR
jgi:hypothetical protein